MKSIRSSQCLSSVYEVWSCLGARTISLPFDTQRITIIDVEGSNSGRLLLTILLLRLPKSDAGRMLPCLPFFLTTRISHKHFFNRISTLYRRIHSPLSMSTKGSQSSNVTKQSAPSVSQSNDPSGNFLNWFRPRLIDRWFISRHPATDTFFHLLNAL